jgi:hypothetical protein
MNRFLVFLKMLGIAIVVAIGAGFLSLALATLYLNGSFTRWQSLDGPPEQITRIAGATLYTVTVETISKTLYMRDVEVKNNQWQETSFIPTDYSSAPECDLRIPEDIQKENIIDIDAACELSPAGENMSIYALRENGNVYLWHRYPGLGELYWMVLFVFPIGAVIGFLGTWVYFSVTWLKKFH